MVNQTLHHDCEHEAHKLLGKLGVHPMPALWFKAMEWAQGHRTTGFGIALKYIRVLAEDLAGKRGQNDLG